MARKLINKLKTVNLCHLLWIIILSETCTAILDIVISYAWWGRISKEVFLIGSFDSFIVSAIVGFLILYLSGRSKEAEKRYEILVEQAGDAICMVDMEGNFLEVNERMEELSGYRKDELLRMNFSRVRLPEKDEMPGSSFEQEVRIGAPYEISVVRKDGGALQADMTVTFNEYMQRQTAFIIIRDITHRKMMEQDLQKFRNNLEDLVRERTAELAISNMLLQQEIVDRQFVEARLNLLKKAVESIPTGITITDTERKIIYTNPAEATMHGYLIEELMHQDVTIFAPPETWRPLKFDQLQEKDVWRRESLNVRKDGSSFPVLLTSVPVTDDHGIPVGMITLCDDITEKRLAEEALRRSNEFSRMTEKALRESEERFRQIFEQNEDALFLFEPGTLKLIDANPAAVSLYGYSIQEFAGKDPSLFLNPPEYMEFLKVADIDSIRIDKITNVKKDGTTIIVSIRGKTIKLENSDVLYCSFRDITEKMRLEEEARFMQAKLIQANKMTALGTLVSGVAHEINNPNNFILFNTQLLTTAWQDIIRLLSEHYQDADFHIGGLPYSEMRDIIPRLLSGISEGSRRIKNIVANLKSFARHDRAGLNGRVDINGVIRISATILGNQIDRHTESFRLLLAEGLPTVRGSSQQLEQVIINLIMNALFALPGKECGVLITTSFDNIARCVIIRVKDEGDGMTPEVLERIMEPFFTTRLDQGGTGLGLSISYSIIKEHQGSLRYESEPGHGTTATITLPEYEDSPVRAV